jgi:predicted kinase
MSQTFNDHLVLLVGKSAAGKSASFKDIKNPEGVWYMNCESGY